jgi:ABC-type multidrug transport system ATPase subunit/ABC-type multidrug transport system permease subunit
MSLSVDIKEDGVVFHIQSEMELIPNSSPEHQKDLFWDTKIWNNNLQKEISHSKERREVHSLSWTNLSLTVPVVELPGTTKRLLNNVSGAVKSGEMVAIIGGSGAGKSTLLKLLAGEWRTAQASGNLTGTIKIDGIASPSLTAQHHIASVAQEEALLPSLTSEQNLIPTALLNRPKNRRTVEEQLAFLNNQIDILGLSSCRNTLCMKLSGGQKRLVSVAIQLLAESSLLLCDEPTSGLDSKTADSLLHTFRDLADHKGVGIVCSIHQPSNKLFNLFDKVLILCEGGEMVYYGHVSKALEYCKMLHIAYPSNQDVASTLIDSLGSNPSISIGNNSSVNEDRKLTTIADITHSYNAYVTEKEQAHWIDMSKHDGKIPIEIASSDAAKEDERIGWLEQTQILMQRSFLQKRGQIFTYMEFFRVAIIAIFASLFWLQLPLTKDHMQDRYGALFFGVSLWYTTPMLTGVTVFPSEQAVVKREIASQSYNLSAYFIAKTLSELPVMIIYPTLFVILFYWTVGFQANVSFMVYWISIVLLVVCSDSVGLCISMLTPGIPQAINAAQITIVLLLLTSGLYLSLSLIPVWIRWTTYLGYVRYIFSILAQSELQDEVFTCSVDDTTCIPETGAELLEANGLNIIPRWGCALIVLGMMLFFRTVAFLQLAKRVKARIQ